MSGRVTKSSSGLLNTHPEFFSLKLVYDGGDRLMYAALDGRPLEL